MLLDQLDRFRSRLAVGVNEIVPVGFDHDERVAADDWFLAVRIVFQRFAVAGRFPFGTGAVESLGPRPLVVGTVTPLFDPTGHAHVKDLADSRRIVAVVLEVLRPGRPISDLRTWILVTHHVRSHADSSPT